MKTKLLFLVFALMLSLSAISQQNNMQKDSVKYYRLMIIYKLSPGSYLTFEGAKDIVLDNGNEYLKIGLKKDSGDKFKTEMDVINYISNKYNLELMFRLSNSGDPEYYFKTNQL